jgi:hypothetical protein
MGASHSGFRKVVPYAGTRRQGSRGSKEGAVIIYKDLVELSSQIRFANGPLD